jgi:hypothetical protein
MFGLEQPRSVSLNIGESLEINPKYNFGVVLRLIEHDDRVGYEHKFCFVLRQTAEIDVVDEDLRYIPLDRIDPSEASTRMNQAQMALESLIRF